MKIKIVGDQSEDVDTVTLEIVANLQSLGIDVSGHIPLAPIDSDEHQEHVEALWGTKVILTSITQ
jgi:ribosomal protein S10